MLYFLKAPTQAVPKPPQRQRVIIIGAGTTGICAAYHLGKHSLLLEQRTTLEVSNDLTHDFPLGTARGGALGDEDAGADGQRPGVSGAEREALFITCGSTGKGPEGEHSLTQAARWKPPDLSGSIDDDRQVAAQALRALAPLLSGELRLGARVVAISPSQHLLELADGSRLVYDKLLSTLSLPALALLVFHELPARVRHDESLRYWLSERDIELGDRVTQVCHGDVDEFAAGKRLANLIGRALVAKFQRQTPATSRGTRLFEPRVVRAVCAPATP